MRDPRQPGRYLLGIECDGAAYQASRSARDRDRLRQAVLEGMGWNIQRLWSTDWFQRPDQQLRRLQEAIQRAQAGPPAGATLAPLKVTPTAPPAPEIIQREAGSAPREGGDLGAFAQPYREAKFAVPRISDPAEMDRHTLGEFILRIVREEGPVHEDEVLVRVRDLWNLGRAGSRLQVSKGTVFGIDLGSSDAGPSWAISATFAF